MSISGKLAQGAERTLYTEDGGVHRFFEGLKTRFLSVCLASKGPQRNFRSSFYGIRQKSTIGDNVLFLEVMPLGGVGGLWGSLYL